MEKQTGKFRLVVASLVMVFCLFLAGLASATSENGKITLTKSATKVYEDSADDNLTHGRYAEVNLSVTANPYTNQEIVVDKLDIILVIDGSGSMAWGPNGQYDYTKPNRLDSVKAEAYDFIDTMMDSSGNVQVGLVEFGNQVKQSFALTNNKLLALSYTNNLSANGGTNLQSGIAEANRLLDSGAREDAKQLVIILTDGVPTYFTGSDGKIHGTGNSDLYECTAWDKRGRCTEHDGPKPSDKAKESLDALKADYTNADVYTITFGNESEAASILAKVNPVNDKPVYSNLTALDGDALKEQFSNIADKAKNIIGKNSIVTDIIPAYFSLTDESIAELEENGVTITKNLDGTTTLTWNIGTIEAGKTNTLSYIVKADDNYHGSMYTNQSAVLKADVEEANPYYDTTEVELSFEKPTVEIPAIANDDHYSSNSSYVGYQQETINGTTILTNDLNKIIMTDKKDDTMSVNVTDTIVVNENENTVKNLDGSYNIYKDNVLQGVLVMNEDGSFTFTSEEGIVGEVNFSYHIKTTINQFFETEYVYSNDAIVTLKINKRETFDINGSKIWNDADNQDGIRPTSIEVSLYANDVFQKTITVSSDWSYSFNDLYRYEIGHENDENYIINYKIEEKTSIDGYKTTYDNYNIINTHEPEVITINGTKTWDDNDNQDGFRPDSITVNLTGKVGNDVVVSDSKVITSNDNWTYSFTNLDKYYKGQLITYTISENSVANYTTTVNGYNITNTHKPEVITINGTKTWDDNDNQDGFRPASITVNLTGKVGNDVVVSDSKVITSNDNWTYSFTNLDKYYKGQLITYTISENSVANYTTTVNGYNITNTHKPEVITIEGTKTWDDNDNQDGFRPDSITVNLTGKVNNKIVVSDSKVVTSNDNWTYSFSNLDKYYKGQLITYTISENTVNKYTTTIDGYDIINSHNPSKITVSGSKTWDDNDNQDGFRPDSITVNLNGKVGNKTVVSDSKVVTSSDNWSYSFTNLDKYYKGQLITYTISENTVNKYTTTVNGYDITNTHEPEVITIEGTKTWNDNNDQDRLRPDSITVNLTGKVNNKIVVSDSKVVTSNDNWTYSFSNLDKYYKGQLIVYTITEDNVDNYTTTIDGYDIINSHNPSKITVSGSKTWDDNGNQDGLRPNSITVNLTGKVGEKTVVTDSKVVTSNDNWRYSFTDLDEYYNGEKIVYTISEDSVDNYTTEINGYNLTNTHTPITISINGEKVWVDKGNRDGFRPNSITITLEGKIGNKIVYTETKTVTSDDNWIYTFDNLDKYSNGQEINYTVSETSVAEYETSYDETNPYVIINTHNVNDITVSGTKTWDDNNDQDRIRPNSITVYLTGKVGNDVVVSDSKIVTSNDNWSYSFTELPEYKDGKLISYSISESEVSGYSTTINGYNITNTHVPEVITIDGIKAWDDNNDQDRIRPDSITVYLTGKVGNDVVVSDSKIVTSNDNWSFSFKNQPKYSNGTEIVYTIEEADVDGYTSKITDFNITNSHTPETISYYVSKEWNDSDNQDGIRPNSIKVSLLANGDVIATQIITKANNWTYVFENLPKYNQGELINYTIVEDEVLGYKSSIDNSITENNHSIITNTHEVEKTDITVSKTWDDYNNKFNSRPNEIIVHLLANGKIVKTITITANDNWTYTFTNLDKYSNGQLIEYTIIENSVVGYETIYDGFNITNKLLPFGNTNVSEITPPNTMVDSSENNNYWYLYLLIGLPIILSIRKCLNI